jgi:hypothetical protein
MAKSVAPYLRPKLGSVDYGGKIDLSFAAELAAPKNRDEQHRRLWEKSEQAPPAHA